MAGFHKTDGADPRLFRYVNSAMPIDSELVGENAMPILRVGSLKGVFKVYSARNAAGSPELPNTRAHGEDRKARQRTPMSEVSYLLEQSYSGVAEMAIEEFRDAQATMQFGGVDPRIELAYEAQRDAVLKMERDNAGIFFTASNWATEADVAALNGVSGISGAGNLTWTDPSSTPDIDMIKVREYLRKKTYGVANSQFGIRLERDTFVALQIHVASSNIVQVGDIADGVAMAIGQKVASEEATLRWIKTITGIDDVQVFNARYESADPGLTSVPAGIGTSGSFWMGILRGGQMRAGRNGGSVEAVACAQIRAGEWNVLSGMLPNNELAIKHQIAVELQQKPQIFDNTLGLRLYGCAD